MMNSKERVMLTFSHQEPDRVPVWCGASPEFLSNARNYLGLDNNEAVYKRFGDDFRRVYAKFNGPDEFSLANALPEGATSRSPFGIARHGYGCGQPLSHPLKDASLKDVHAYPWPKAEWISAKEIKEQAQRWKGEYAILGGDWSPFWHDAIDLLGMENLMIKMYEEPEVVDAVFQHVMAYYLSVNERIFEEAAEHIDIFFVGNDLGSQTGPLLGRGLFSRFVAPHLKSLADLGHRYNLKVMLHCCGSIEPLIPILIENGIDALQALQPDAYNMEPASLKKKYGDNMVFNGCLDSHHILINGTPELTRMKTRELLDIMKPGGGFVLSPSHDYLLEETPVENVLAMYDTAAQYGTY